MDFWANDWVSIALFLNMLFTEYTMQKFPAWNAAILWNIPVRIKTDDGSILMTIVLAAEFMTLEEEISIVLSALVKCK